MVPPTFTPLSGLTFFANEEQDLHLEIENFKTSLYVPLEEADEDISLTLYDETGNGKVFLPLQFHIHAPSEHTVNGQTYDLELHIVH